MSADPTAEAAPRLFLGTTRGQWALLATGVAVTVALAAGLILGRASAPSAAVSNRVDLGFARDMRVHHAQAVEMASVQYLRTRDPNLRYLAYDILTAQQAQIGMMSGWLQLWGQPPSDSDEPTMAWMGHEGPMPGMATQGELTLLRTLPVTRLDEHFLRLMIRHHRGAVPMAEHAARRATSEHVRELAAAMGKGQQVEIDYMQGYLRSRGHAPEGPVTPSPSPSGVHGGHG